MQSISDSHLAQLQASAIAENVITERGYWTATTKAELARLGFGRNQQNVPALVIPIRDVHGDIALYQCRPDMPRVKGDKPLKYETPAGARLVLDVPASVREQRGNPDVPLWITEGSKKVDSAVSHGLVCAGVVGVYGWRGTNDQGGKLALPDLEYIAWNDRKVYMAFDSDVMEKPQVHEALRRLADVLKSRGAHVLYVYLPSPDGRKIGLDDYLADGGTVTDLLATATDTLKRPPMEQPEDEPDELPEPSPEALQAALALLNAPDLLDQADGAVIALGHAGDTPLRKLVYLVLVSRLLARPLNLVVTGPSSAGKSFLVNTTCKLFPAYTYYQLAGMSERVLAYTDEPLQNRFLIIGEAAALSHDGPGAMLVRSIVWDGNTRYSYVDKGPDGLHTVTIEKPGPTGLITTTTGTLEAELLTRMLTAHISDTPDTTRTILRATAGIANGHAPEPPDTEPWHAAQWWLQTQGRRDVAIPYSGKLAELVPAHLVRMRRDFTQILTLIQAHALLYQHQRDSTDDGRILADERDYEAIYELVSDIFCAIAAEGVTPVLRETVARLVELTPDSEATVTVTQLARAMERDRSTVQKRVARLLDGGWLTNSETREHRPAKLRPGDTLPADRPALPSPAALFESVSRTPGTVSEFPRSHYAGLPDVEAENSAETDNSHTMHTPHTEGPPVGTVGTSGNCPFSHSLPDVEAENTDSGNVGTAEVYASDTHTLFDDVARWLEDGTLAILNQPVVINTNGHTMTPDQLRTLVPIWLADLDNTGATLDHAQSSLQAAHAGISALKAREAA